MGALGHTRHGAGWSTATTTAAHPGKGNEVAVAIGPRLIDTHVLKRCGKGVTSPVDDWQRGERRGVYRRSYSKTEEASYGIVNVRHSREGGNPGNSSHTHWTPAFARVTTRSDFWFLG